MSAADAESRMNYLHIVSVFPALTEAFVLREIRTMRGLGCRVTIGQLRSAGKTPVSAEFEDLRPSVVDAKVFTPGMLAAIFFFALRKSGTVWTCLKLVAKSFPDPINTAKLAYVLLASMDLAYRSRAAGIQQVHGHHLHSEAVSAMFIAKLLGLPYSFKCYTVKTYYPRGILAEVVRKAKFIVADTIQVRNFLESLQADSGRIFVLRNAVNLREFPMRLREAATAPPTILAVGRLDFKKGFHVLLSACAILRDEGVHFRCLIVGSGDEWNSLLARKKSLRLEEQVEMTGSLRFSEVQNWYEQATLMAVPSVVAPDGSTDGLPTVVIEAFARGVPVVGSSTAGIPEVIHNGVNGFVVAPGSSRELANRVKELLSDSDLRHKFATAARRTAEREFDLDRNAHALVTLMFGNQRQDKLADTLVACESVVEHTTSAR